MIDKSIASVKMNEVISFNRMNQRYHGSIFPATGPEVQHVCDAIRIKVSSLGGLLDSILYFKQVNNGWKRVEQILEVSDERN